jgi:DNA-binding transcriptional ArsR family regulator
MATKKERQAALDAADLLEAQQDAVAHGMLHPLRRVMLARFSGPDAKKGQSPNEMSKALGEPLTNVSYHVRMLLDRGLVELVETEPRRGALEHYYRKTELGVTAQRTQAALANRLSKGVK